MTSGTKFPHEGVAEQAIDVETGSGWRSMNSITCGPKQPFFCSADQLRVGGRASRYLLKIRVCRLPQCHSTSLANLRRCLSWIGGSRQGILDNDFRRSSPKSSKPQKCLAGSGPGGGLSQVERRSSRFRTYGYGRRPLLGWNPESCLA